jgi:hypothetical protein
MLAFMHCYLVKGIIVAAHVSPLELLSGALDPCMLNQMMEAHDYFLPVGASF